MVEHIPPAFSSGRESSIDGGGSNNRVSNLVGGSAVIRNRFDHPTATLPSTWNCPLECHRPAHHQHFAGSASTNAA